MSIEKCPHCPIIFSYRKSLNRHILTYHQEMERGRAIEKDELEGSRKSKSRSRSTERGSEEKSKDERQAEMAWENLFVDVDKEVEPSAIWAACNKNVQRLLVHQYTERGELLWRS